MKVTIVKFKDGKYAVRRNGGFLFLEYRFLEAKTYAGSDYWWSRDDAHKYSMMDTLTEARRLVNEYRNLRMKARKKPDNGEPVEDHNV